MTVLDITNRWLIKCHKLFITRQTNKTGSLINVGLNHFMKNKMLQMFIHNKILITRAHSVAYLYCKATQKYN